MRHEEIKRMDEFYRTHTLKETAKEFGISVSTVKKYASPKRIPLTEEELKTRRVKAVVKRRKKLKRLLVDYKGGKCIKCGYNKSYSALQFHHRNPEEKEFGLSMNGLCRSLEVMKKEVDKCDLLCANCHAEFHGDQ